MRFKLTTLAALIAGIFLAVPTASADDVQEQLRLMEQRMAEMEDRLQATSEELDDAKTTVAAQQTVLNDAGLAEEETGVRSGVGDFLKEVDLSGVVAASYNYRFLDGGDDGSQGGNVGLYRHPDSNTFALDQLWMTIDKPVSEESRAGFHAEWVYGKTAAQRGGGSSYDDSGYLYMGYVSYLAPIGDGVQIDAGRIGTPLGVEALQTNKNFNITNGLVFGLIPINHVGIQATTPITDNLMFTAGFVNDVYTDNNFDLENNKAFHGALALTEDMFGLKVGAIVGEDSGLGCVDADDDCYTSVFDIVMKMDPSDVLSLWLEFAWVRKFGERQTADGDAYGLSAAGRYAITDETGFSTRVEYVRSTPSFNTIGANQAAAIGGGTATSLGNLSEIVSLTNTIDHSLTEDLKVRFEVRWDHIVDNQTQRFINGENGPSNPGSSVSSRDSQVVGLAEIYYEF
jgi:Putative beta-barrel porin-2, OmpL-like. bbp2